MLLLFIRQFVWPVQTAGLIFKYNCLRTVSRRASGSGNILKEFIFPDAERMFTVAEYTFTIVEHTFRIGKHKLYRGEEYTCKAVWRMAPTRM